ncbi:hypothetical protein SG34_028565 [Thalassomonas viridans]|uniref:Uncharacterized protein n=1 Tax=Thalassomonas viridans TaxID=137584 RepID=A0AAE9Z1Q9_9GAMM|nr:hypothetical protein [Thalassomonas viridans]WDE05201.1 hypothetical protein SG34_028565 [Thalassomonas viridans]
MSDNNSTDTWLTTEIYKLNDEFSQFSGKCAFLCQAFAAVSSNPECIDEQTIYGLDFYALWLKEKIEAFDHQIENLNHRLRKESDL